MTDEPCGACGGEGDGEGPEGESMECPHCAGAGHVGHEAHWCFQDPEGILHGNYLTREAAIAGAVEELGGVPGCGSKVNVGRQVDLLPQEFVPQRYLDDLLEDMDTLLQDNRGLEMDGGAFQVRADVGVTAEKRKERAERALDAALRKWAKGWLICEVFDIADAEEVVL